MRRVQCGARADWKGIVEGQGLVYNTTPNGEYWHEDHYYELSRQQVDVLEASTNELHARCLDAAQFIIDKDRFADLGIPDHAVPAIISAWNNEPPSIYGRFDLAYDGIHPPKLLEYNADTPTSLLEAAVIQWYWLQDRFPQHDQFNDIHDRLVSKWKELGKYLHGDLFFAHMDTEEGEDLMTVAYLRETAMQAELNTLAITIPDIGYGDGTFYDLEDGPIRSIFKLYPWEWMVHGDFGRDICREYSKVQWIEPIWKMLLSNKALLAVLWEMFPNHPNLLPAYIEGADVNQSGRAAIGGIPYKEFVRKPKMSREGANIQINCRHGRYELDGDYGEEGHVIQQYYDIPTFDGARPVIGSWVIDGEAAGIGIRENDGMITDNTSRFVPHLFI